MNLQVQVIFIVNVLIAIITEVAGKVLHFQVVEKERVVVKVLFAEITPRMPKSFHQIISAPISIIYVIF